jgi:transcriptional regulator with XRE-family HTH domain
MSPHLQITESGDISLTIEPGTPNECTFETHRVDCERFFTTARLGMYLLQLRRQRGINLRQLAKATGISNGYLSLIENNRRKSPPGLQVLEALATFYGLSLESLLLVGGLRALPSESSTNDEPHIDLNIAFQQLVLNSALETPFLRSEQLHWLAPEVKRAWLAFAVRLYETTRREDSEVQPLMERLAHHPALQSSATEARSP